MRNALPEKPRARECSFVNLDDATGPGSHWVAYIIRNKDAWYFDSFGDLRPPLELVEYFGEGARIKYNHERVQNFYAFVCGHLCLEFLINSCGLIFK